MAFYDNFAGFAILALNQSGHSGNLALAKYVRKSLKLLPSLAVLDVVE